MSLPSIFNLKSIYLLSPLYDSGARIYCNKQSKISGFEKWDVTNETLFNRGITWSYFESDNKMNGIMVLSIEIDGEDELIEKQLLQIINFKNNFEQKIVSSGIKKYETFISGDFKIEFNLMDTIPEIKKYWDMLDSSYLSIYNKSDNDSPSNTHFILYSKYNIENDTEKSTIVSKYTILDDSRYSINFDNIKDDNIKDYNNNDNIKNEIRIDISEEVEKEKVKKNENETLNIETPQETNIKNTIFINMDSFRYNHFENTKHSSDEEWTEI